MTDDSEGELGALRKLRHVASLLAGEGDPRTLVPLVLDQAIELVGAERGFAILIEGRGPQARFEVAAARNLDREEVHRPEFKVSRSIVQRVASSGNAERISDAKEDEGTRDIPSVQLLHLRSVLCVPLRVRGETLGVLYVDHRYATGEFEPRDLATLEAFAVPAAIALDMARQLELRARSEDAVRRSRDELAARIETIEHLRVELAERYRDRAREANRLRDEAFRRGGPPAEGEDELPGMVVRSAGMKRVVRLLRKVAPSDAPVLILGESGTGKEVLARALHTLSRRATGPFWAENAGALADPLLESELFGHEEGSFTGAVKAHAGVFEQARGGTLFLDEVAEMSPSLQAKLLRVLQEHELRRVGGHEKIAVDVRIVAATHRDLEAMVAEGSFRADLYYRLNVVRLEAPPLRERPEDIPALIDRFLERAGADAVAIEPQARELLLAHAWPGNVRELENEIRRLMVVAGPGGVVRPGLLSPAILGGRPQGTATRDEGADRRDVSIEGVWPLDRVEREMIERALRRAHGNKTVAAKLLGLAKTSLYNRLEKHGLLERGAEGADSP